MCPYAVVSFQYKGKETGPSPSTVHRYVFDAQSSMVNGLHLYSAFIQSALQYCLTFTHSYTGGGADRAR